MFLKSPRLSHSSVRVKPARLSGCSTGRTVDPGQVRGTQRLASLVCIHHHTAFQGPIQTPFSRKQPLATRPPPSVSRILLRVDLVFSPPLIVSSWRVSSWGPGPDLDTGKAKLSPDIWRNSPSNPQGLSDIRWQEPIDFSFGLSHYKLGFCHLKSTHS